MSKTEEQYEEFEAHYKNNSIFIPKVVSNSNRLSEGDGLVLKIVSGRPISTGDQDYKKRFQEQLNPLIGKILFTNVESYGGITQKQYDAHFEPRLDLTNEGILNIRIEDIVK